jgi:dihydrolipoamide dehydrogenase
VIGCEVAAAFAAFGSRVTIIEALPRIAANMDADISRFLTRTLTGEGIEVLTETPLERIEDDGGKPVLCAGSRRIEVDAALLSVGRTADLSCLEGLEEKPAMKNGRIVTDEFLQTSIPGVWAAGDIAAGHPMLAHAASKMGECAAANALGDRAACDLRLTPSCIYTIPETASVGLAEEEAQREHAIMTGRFPLTANGRAVAAGETEGFVKVIADKANGEILGVHIAAAAASELIGEASALMAAGVRVQAAAEIIHAHPTVSEALMEACADACGCCLHLPPLRKH